jgi:hypothetical protein
MVFSAGFTYKMASESTKTIFIVTNATRIAQNLSSLQPIMAKKSMLSQCSEHI